MAGIELINIHKTYRVDRPGDVPVLNGIDLSLSGRGRITVILGQSGCGKTTLLRLTGGLEAADCGEDPLGRSAHKTAFVFQEPRLMPWLTVWDNVVFGPAKKRDRIRRRLRRSDRHRGTYPALRKHIRPSSPAECSSGRPLRRALAYEPDLYHDG